MRRLKTLDERLMPDLEAYVQLCFACIDETDMKAVSNLTELSLSTVYRLARGEFTSCMRWSTFAKLGHAAGLSLSVSGHKGIIKQVRVLS